MQKVLYQKKRRIAYITLNRPESLNALDDETNDELSRIWEDFKTDDMVEVAIITGAGKAFCAGADLKTFVPKWASANMLDVRKNVSQGIAGGVTRGLHWISKPIIAAVNGYAIGGGFELALACDIRIASEKAKFGVFEVRHGLHQGDGGLVRLVAIAGVGVALDLTLTGREITADEAFRMGLVTRVAPHDELITVAEDYAEMILGNSRQAIRSAKETILDIIGRTLDDALRLETINSYSCLGDTDSMQRLAAFTKDKGKG